MSVAVQMGLDQADGEMLMRARAWWRSAATDLPLASVADLEELPAWTRAAGGSDRDGLLAQLAARAVDETEAAAALAWLLLPGAARIAGCLHDLSAQIDDLVAGQLWIEVRTHGGTPDHAVAFTILQRVKRAVQADLGVGEGARRKDRTWMSTILTDRIGEYDVPLLIDPASDFGAESELTSLFTAMLQDGALAADEVGLLMSAASTANDLGAPLRGRAGVTSPDALEVLTWLEPSKARSMRRQVGVLLGRVAAYAREHAVRDDTDGLRRARETVWTPMEVAMIAQDPAMEGMLQRFYASLEVSDLDPDRPLEGRAGGTDPTIGSDWRDGPDEWGGSGCAVPA